MSEEKNTIEATEIPETKSTTSTASEPFQPSPAESDTDSITAATQTDFSATESREKLEFDESEIPGKRFFRSNKEDMNFLRDKWILSRINDENLMEYLRLEQKRNDQLQHAKDIREKRIMTAFLLTVSLAAIVAIVYLLKDNPTILVNILYICGLLIGFWVWKNPREK